MTAVERLKDVPLLSCLSNRELKRVARDARENHFDPGTTVVTEGKMGRFGFFILDEGEASVSVGGNEVARLHPGDYFGELSLISEGARTATVTALTPITCFVIDPWDFRDLVKGSPETAWKLLQHVADLLDEERARAKPLAGASSP